MSCSCTSLQKLADALPLMFRLWIFALHGWRCHWPSSGRNCSCLSLPDIAPGYQQLTTERLASCSQTRRTCISCCATRAVDSLLSHLSNYMVNREAAFYGCISHACSLAVLKLNWPCPVAKLCALQGEGLMPESCCAQPLRCRAVVARDFPSAGEAQILL